MALWYKIKREFVKTFIRGDEIQAGSGFITWRTHDPSRVEEWCGHVKSWLKNNATIAQTISAIVGAMAGVIGVVVAVIALLK